MATDLVTPIPQLGTLGWITDVANKADILLAHFFLSDYNQTYFYPGKVTSLPRIMETHGNIATNIVDDLKQSLQTYLSRYYDSVQVDATILNEDTNLTNQAEIQLTIGVNDKGTQRVFGRVLQSTDGKIQSIVKMNNVG